MSDFDRIAALLSDLGRGVRRSVMVEAGLWCATAFFVLFGLTLIVAHLGWSSQVGWLLGISIVASFGGWVWAVFRSPLARTSQNMGEQARLAERLAPELGTAPTSAVDLAQQLTGEDVTFSRELAASYVSRTRHNLDGVELERRFRQERRPYTRLATHVTVIAAVLLGIGFLTLERGRTRLARLIFAPGAARLSDVPLAGDIRISYQYPAYTGLEPRVVEGGDGSISAVVGTQVQLEATAEHNPRSAVLKLEDLSGQPLQEVPMTVEGRTLRASLPVLRDGRYHFALVTDDGERLEDRHAHAIRAVLDTYPAVHMDEPSMDVELRGNQEVSVLWRATDDFGLPEVNLVVEPVGKNDPIKIKLSGTNEADKRLEGRYAWVVSELGLEAGTEARFYIEAFDNDATSGPKRGVSTARRLVLFSARANHERILARQQQAMDALVDWLGAELVAPFPPRVDGSTPQALDTQRAMVEQIYTVASTFVLLLGDMRDDELSKPEVVATFENILEHINAARRKRGARVERMANPNASTADAVALRTQQQQDIEQLEKDIIYLDDLLAIQRIDELKETAKDLLAAQRDLQEMLARYKNTQDPAMRAELERQIRELREKMMELLARMSSIKERLPGEYRNMEAASMLQMGDQLDRLEKLLKEGDLDQAAAELEQLANMIEGMVDSINDAEEEYGGERYQEIRKQLEDFAQSFKELEAEQKALSERTNDLLAEYRKRSVQQAGRNMEELIKKARRETAEALKDLDNMGEVPNVFGIDKDVEKARQRLMDLDALLEHRDLSEALETVQQASEHQENIQRSLQNRLTRFSSNASQMKRAAKANDSALQHTGEVEEMLRKLFPDPSEVLSPEQVAQMQRMAQKQEALERRAAELGQRMDELSSEMPLFGGEPRQDLEGAQGEMAEAQGSLGQSDLPKAAGHERRAVERLGKLREALEQSSQRSGGRGMPMPLGGTGTGKRRGQGTANSQRDVDIKSNPNKEGAEFRESLREASKQRPPQRYEEAVQRYYRELIR